MADKVCEDLEKLQTWLNQQPLCKWFAEKQHQINTGVFITQADRGSIQPEPVSEDEALMAALAKLG